MLSFHLIRPILLSRISSILKHLNSCLIPLILSDFLSYWGLCFSQRFEHQVWGLSIILLFLDQIRNWSHVATHLVLCVATSLQLYLKGPKFCCFKSDRVKFGRNVLQVNTHWSTKSDFRFDVHCQEGSHDVISLRKVLPYGECGGRCCICILSTVPDPYCIHICWSNMILSREQRDSTQLYNEFTGKWWPSSDNWYPLLTN